MLKRIICLITISLTNLCFTNFSSYGLEIGTVSEHQYEYARFGVDGGYYYFEDDGKTMHITKHKRKHDKKSKYSKVKENVEKIIIDNDIKMESVDGLFSDFFCII